MKKPINRVAVVHDLCSIGKAALTNIIPVLSVMDVEVCPIPTMLLSTHTGGFGKPKIEKVHEYIKKCSNHYADIDIKFDVVFIGYLGSKEAIRESVDFMISNRNAIRILDPIFGDGGKCYSNFDMNYVSELKKLVKYSDLITPNYTEGCILTDEEYNEGFSKEKIARICYKLKELGAKQIIITSVPLEDDNLGIVIYEDNNFSILSKKKAEENYPGTGDIFTSVVIGRLIKNDSLEAAVNFAHDFVLRCIKESLKYDYPKREGVLLEKQLKYLL